MFVPTRPSVGLQSTDDGSVLVWFFHILLGSFVPGRDDTVEPLAGTRSSRRARRADSTRLPTSPTSSRACRITRSADSTSCCPVRGHERRRRRRSRFADRTVTSNRTVGIWPATLTGLAAAL